jgi:hypothetical protein
VEVDGRLVAAVGPLAGVLAAAVVGAGFDPDTTVTVGPFRSGALNDAL